MANTGVQGRIVFTGTTNGIPDLIVEAFDIDTFTGDELLGTGKTNATGNYSISYPTSSYGALEWHPDIVVRVYDRYRRVLRETPEERNVTLTTLNVDIELHPNNVSGWLVTNATINPAGTFDRLSSGNAITFLIDNEVGWREMTDHVMRTAGSIHFTMLFFEVPDVITRFTSPTGVGFAVNDQLQAVFKSKGPFLAARLLFNDFSPDALGLLDTASEVTDYFRYSGVELRLYKRLPLAPMHAKMLILDRKIAYLIGSPIMQEYWDTQTHTIRDPRRGTMSYSNQIRVPIHEVNTKIEGPAVEYLDETFALLWNKADPTASPLTGGTAPASQTGTNIAAVQVIRTLPGDASPANPAGETGILEAYQRAIANAKDYIYIEDQYFTSYELIEAMLARLEVNKEVQIILLLNIIVDLPGYTILQPRVVETFMRGVRSIPLASTRVGIFTLWSHEAGAAKTTIMRNYIHSKTAIVDGDWATVGSANTDGPSLNATQVVIPKIGLDITSVAQLGRMTQHANPNQAHQPLRAVETNIAIYNGVDGQPTTPVIDELRCQLWREHLGFTSASDSALTTRPKDGWLELWNDRVTLKLQRLLLDPPLTHEARILPYHKEPKAKVNLAAMGVKTSNLEVQDEVESFNFATGKWK